MILLQTFIHVGVNIRLLPTTGMTLPFLSYGGSSIVSTAIVSGIILNLTKRKLNKSMKKILIVTGGSGGHVIPSLSIYEILKNNFQVQIVTDLRGSKYINNNYYNFSLIDVPNLFSNLLLLPFNLIKFCISILKSYKYLKLNNFNILISTEGICHYLCVWLQVY